MEEVEAMRKRRLRLCCGGGRGKGGGDIDPSVGHLF